MEEVRNIGMRRSNLIGEEDMTTEMIPYKDAEQDQCISIHVSTVDSIINITRTFVRATSTWQDPPPEVLETKNKLVNLCNELGIPAGTYSFTGK